MALAVTRLQNIALALDAERWLDLDSERRVAASAVEITLDPSANVPIGTEYRAQIDGVWHRFVMTERGVLAEVA